MTELEKMWANLPYDGTDPELRAYQLECRARKEAFDAIPANDWEARVAGLAELVGSMNGVGVIAAPFYTDFGKHIHLGNWAFVNAGATFLDSATITLEDNVAVGPNVQFITASHPKRPEDRMIPREGQFPPVSFIIEAKPILVRKQAWIGAGATILPGVTIGEAAIVGAASVVTTDVPARMIVAGNPARIIGSIDASARRDRMPFTTVIVGSASRTAKSCVSRPINAICPSAL
jgi:maltose O-acetyltransferase